MAHLIAGYIRRDERPVSESMAELFFDGLEGKVVATETEIPTKGGDVIVKRTYVAPDVLIRMLHNYMLRTRELRLKKRAIDLKENPNKGQGKGIRIVLPSIPADPLLKPGEPPRPLRLLGQNPDLVKDYSSRLRR